MSEALSRGAPMHRPSLQCAALARAVPHQAQMP